jgi:hypothetical protein
MAMGEFGTQILPSDLGLVDMGTHYRYLQFHGMVYLKVCLSGEYNRILTQRR